MCAGDGDLLVQAGLLECRVHIAHGRHNETGDIDGALGYLGSDSDVGDHGGRVVWEDAVLEPGVDVGLILRKGEEVGVGDADHELYAGVGEGLDDVDVGVVDAHILDGLLLDELRHLVWSRQVVRVAAVADANLASAALPCDCACAVKITENVNRARTMQCLALKGPFPNTVINLL